MLAVIVVITTMTRDFGTLGRLRLQVSSQARVLCHVVVFSSYRLPRKTLETTSRDRSRPNVKARGYYTIPLPCAGLFSILVLFFYMSLIFSLVDLQFSPDGARAPPPRSFPSPFWLLCSLTCSLWNLPRRWLMTFTEAPEMLCREEWWRPQLQLHPRTPALWSSPLA